MTEESKVHSLHCLVERLGREGVRASHFGVSEFDIQRISADRISADRGIGQNVVMKVPPVAYQPENMRVKH